MTKSGLDGQNGDWLRKRSRNVAANRRIANRVGWVESLRPTKGYADGGPQRLDPPYTGDTQAKQ